MNNKMLIIITTVIIFVVISTIFTTVAKAKGLNFLCSKNRNIIVALKNEAEIEKAKSAILKIPKIKIIKITYRDKEWSKKVNKYDLPNMENPFKNEFIIYVDKKANIDEVFNKIKAMSFVENVKYASDEK